MAQEASLRFDDGDYDKAIVLLQQIAESNPADASPYRRLGVVLARAGRHDEAIEQFKKALALNADPDVYRELAQAYRTVGTARGESTSGSAAPASTKEERLRARSGGR